MEKKSTSEYCQCVRPRKGYKTLNGKLVLTGRCDSCRKALPTSPSAPPPDVKPKSLLD